MAAEGVRTGRLPGIAFGAAEPPVVDGGVKSGVLSDSGDSAEEVGAGTEEAVQQKTCYEAINIKNHRHFERF